MNFGLPLSGSVTDVANDKTDDLTDAQMEQVNTMIEPRLSFTVPLVDEEIRGRGLTVGAGLTIDDFMQRPPGSKANNQMVSGHRGLTWQFGIKGTGRR